MATAGVQILVTANAGQAGGEMAKFADQTKVATLAVNNLSRASAVVTAGNVSLASATKTTTSGLHALGRIASAIGFQFMPGMTSSVMLGAGALKDLSKAATAAQISVGAMSVALAGLAIAGATANEWWKLASSRVNEENAATKTAQANERLAESLLKVAKARRDAGVINEEQFIGIQSGVAQAKLQPSNEAANNALVAMMNKLVNEQGPMQRKEFDALRLEEQQFAAKSVLTTKQIILDTTTKQAELDLQMVTIADELASIERLRQHTANGLKQGAIDEAEQRKFEMQDLGRIYELESKLKDIRAQAIQSSPFITEANKFSQMRAGGLSKSGEAADPSSLPQQMAAGWVQLQDQIGTVAQNVAGMFQNVVGGAISNVSAGISGLIKGTTTWANVLMNIGSSILDTVIDSIVRMFVAWIAGDRAKSTAAAANATAEAAAKAPGALLDSISSFGIAAAVGAAAFIAAMAISGAFAEGGRPPAGQMALVGERGPELFVPDTAGTIIPAHQTAQMMSGGGGGGAKNNYIFFDKRAAMAAMEDDIDGMISRAIHRSRSS